MFTRLFKKCLQNKELQPAESAESSRPFPNDTRATDRNIKHPERARLTKKGFAGVANPANNLQVQEQVDGAAFGHDICFRCGGQVPRVPQGKARVYGNVSGVGNNEHPGFFSYPQEVVDTENDEFWVGGIALGNEQCPICRGLMTGTVPENSYIARAAPPVPRKSFPLQNDGKRPRRNPHTANDRPPQEDDSTQRPAWDASTARARTSIRRSSPSLRESRTTTGWSGRGPTHARPSIQRSSTSSRESSRRCSGRNSYTAHARSSIRRNSPPPRESSIDPRRNPHAIPARLFIHRNSPLDRCMEPPERSSYTACARSPIERRSSRGRNTERLVRNPHIARI